MKRLPLPKIPASVLRRAEAYPVDTVANGIGSENGILCLTRWSPDDDKAADRARRELAPYFPPGTEFEFAEPSGSLPEELEAFFAALELSVAGASLSPTHELKALEPFRPVNDSAQVWKRR